MVHLFTCSGTFELITVFLRSSVLQVLCYTLIHTLYFREAFFLRLPTYRHVNCAPYRGVSSLLVLGEDCPCNTCLTSPRGCEAPPQPTCKNTENFILLWNTTQGYTVLNIDLWTLVLVERPSDTIVPGYINTHTHTKLNLWARLEDK